MEIINQNVNDMLLLFKTKIQDAISLIENMPNDTRRDVWQFWKEVSKTVKTSTRPRPIKSKWRVQQVQIKSEPKIEVIKENEELELSIVHLQEHAERQDGDDDDASDVHLPIAFTQDLNTPVAIDKEQSYGYAPDLQLLYTSVYSSDTANTAVCSSNHIPVCSSETVNTIVYSSEANNIPVCSSETVYSSDINGISVCSSEAASISVCSYEDVNTDAYASESATASAAIAEFSDDPTSLLDTVHDTCEVYTTDGTHAILVATEVQVEDDVLIHDEIHVQNSQEINQNQSKKKRGRPKKVKTGDASESFSLNSLPTTTCIKPLSSRPKRTKKVKDSSIYYYSDGTNRKKDNSDEHEQSGHDSDVQENIELLFNENQLEMGDKENEVHIEISPNEKRKRFKITPSYDVGPVTCPECGVQLAYSSSLAAHMRKHSGARPFKCSICDKGFTTKANMLRHELTHTGARPFPCPHCDKSFTEAKSLEVHNRTHTGEKPYVCKICNACFRQRGTLQAHIYCHTGHKGHLCDVCGKAFRQKTQLREHQKRHTNQKTVKCDVCEKMFYGKGELFRHSLQHSGVRPYQCSMCQKTFTRLQYLREHTNIHTGKKPHVCSECSAAFHDMASLYRHQAKHKQQAKKAAIETVDIKKELFGSEVIIVNDHATDDDLRDLIAEASETGQIQVSHSTENQLQAAAQSIIDEALPVAQVYQITYVDDDLDQSSRSDNTQTLPTVDFSAINLLANATQLSLEQ